MIYNQKLLLVDHNWSANGLDSFGSSNVRNHAMIVTFCRHVILKADPFVSSLLCQVSHI